MMHYLLSTAVAVFVSAASIGYLLLRRRYREQRASQEYCKRSQSNEHFLRGMTPTNVPSDFSLAVRDIVAELAGVSSNSVFHSDKFSLELSELPFWNDPDAFDFTSKVKAHLGINLGDDAIVGGNFYKLPPNYSVADLVVDLWRIAVNVDHTDVTKLKSLTAKP